MDEKELLSIINYLQKDLKELKKRLEDNSCHNGFDYVACFKLAYNIVICDLEIAELLR